MSGLSSRRKGHQFERDVVQLLRGIGYEAITSRVESKALDDAGVDIYTDAPYNIQCKYTDKAPSYHRLLNEMPTDKAPVVFHKRARLGTVVVIRLEDFLVNESCLKILRGLDKS